jgi:type 1 fimbria pilin
MRASFVVLAAAVVAALPFASAAQSAGVVAIGGHLVPSSCTLSVDAGGVSFGDIALREFDDAGGTAQPDARATQVRVACTGPTLLALRIRDNRHDTLTGADAGNPRVFGIGLADSGSQLGAYRITPAVDGLVNGAPGPILRSGDMAAWVAGSSDWAKYNVATPVGHAFLSPGAGTAPTATTTAIIPVSVALTLAPLASLQLTQRTVIDGSATVEMIYL